MRTAMLTALVLVLAAVAAVPSDAAAKRCGEVSCATPSCWADSVPVRPGMRREQLIGCERLAHARLVSAPAHTTITDVSGDDGNLRFTTQTATDVPVGEDAAEQAVFEVKGSGDPVSLTIALRAIPLTENAPPECVDASQTLRTDGTGPAVVNVYQQCADPDGDEVTMDGSGPGVFLDAPFRKPAWAWGDWWRYRTATSAGTEQATVWATDVLGARSADATTTVTVGPGVDRLPRCWPVVGYNTGESEFTVLARPGLPRSVGLGCFDDDEDDFSLALTGLPAAGVVLPSPPEPGAGGHHLDLTYTPAGVTTDTDSFEVTASGPLGAAPPTRVTVLPRPLPDNGGGSCYAYGAYAAADTVAELNASCEDDEGDPLTARVTEAPAHGSAGPPVLTPRPDGRQLLTVAFTPDPGFTGADCIKLVVSDGHGFEAEVRIDVAVADQPAPTPLDPGGWGPVPLPTPLPVFLPPAPIRPGPVPAIGKPYARLALGTRSVQRIEVLPDVVAWVPSRLSRARLRRDRRAPGMLLSCTSGCTAQSTAALTGVPRRLARAARSRASVSLTAGQPQLLWATAPPAALKRTAHAKVALRVGIQRGGERRTVRRSIRVG